MVARPRQGFSLMEMLVATAILMVAVGVLTELADVGRQHARGAEDAATAERICQNVLDEVLCGARPLQSDVRNRDGRRAGLDFFGRTEAAGAIRVGARLGRASRHGGENSGGIKARQTVFVNSLGPLSLGREDGLRRPEPACPLTR